MERRGGCCIARYRGEPALAWKMDKIMLRFRPIAPKPAAAGATTPPSDGSPTVPRGGRKRRSSAAKDGAGGRGRKRKKEETSAPAVAVSAAGGGEIVTLPLMPETPERKEAETPSATPSPEPVVPAAWKAAVATGKVVAPRPVRPAGSVVTVECVTDTWREAGGWGVGVLAAKMGAQRDTCPVFLSDEMDRVTWTNEAYRRMVVGSGEEEEEDDDDGDDGDEEVKVALVTRGMVSACGEAFTCRVRVRYACGKGKGSLAAPCDVWRLDGGGLAWRLDVKAALSLSLGG